MLLATLLALTIVAPMVSLELKESMTTVGITRGLGELIVRLTHPNICSDSRETTSNCADFSTRYVTFMPV
jgi:hypothetical protein